MEKADEINETARLRTQLRQAKEALADAHRTEVSNQFNAAHNQYAQAQGALWSLVDYLQDIRQALSTDLTTRGLEAVKPLVSTANTNASKVQTALRQARTDLTALSTAMSSASGVSGR